MSHLSATSTSDTIKQWRRLNREQWQQLTDFGIQEGAELELDFTFLSSEQKLAYAFSTELATECGYQTEVFLHEIDQDLHVWAVVGTAPVMKVSVKVLDAWVGDLVERSGKYDCTFDGWGAFPRSLIGA